MRADSARGSRHLGLLQTMTWPIGMVRTIARARDVTRVQLNDAVITLNLEVREKMRSRLKFERLHGRMVRHTYILGSSLGKHILATSRAG